MEVNYAYWILLIIFGIFGCWHAISPAGKGQEWRNACAALVLYGMMGLIGLRYFLLVAALLLVAVRDPLAATTPPLAVQSGHHQACHQ